MLTVSKADSFSEFIDGKLKTIIENFKKFEDSYPNAFSTPSPSHTPTPSPAPRPAPAPTPAPAPAPAPSDETETAN